MDLRSFSNNQSGGVSIYISMIIMTILILMTVTFARNMGIGHTASSESQLNVQAAYAAETGIGDARHRVLEIIDQNNRIGATTSSPVIINGITTTPYVAVDHTTPEFGKGVALEGDCLFVSSSSYFYAYEDDSVNNTYISTDQQGSAPPRFNSFGNISTGCTGTSLVSSAISGNLNNELIALNDKQVILSNPSNNTKQIKIQNYTYNASTLQQSTPSTLIPNSISRPSGSSSSFGSSIALNNSFLVVGDPDSKKVYVYKYDNPTILNATPYTISGSITGNFGYSVALHDTTLAIGDPDSDKVHIYKLKQGTPNRWDEIHSIDGSPSSKFGTDIDLSSELLAVGAPDDNSNLGGVYIYEYANSGWLNLSEESILGAKSGNSFGASVSLKRDNSLLAVGAPPENTTPPPPQNGEVHVYKIKINTSPNPLFRTASSFSLEETECQNEATPEYDFNFNLNDDIRYSCLTIDLTPDFLYYQHLDDQRGLNILLKTAQNDDADAYENLDKLNIEWINSGIQENDTLNFNTTSYPRFPSSEQWNYSAPILKVQMTGLDWSNGFNQDFLLKNTKVFYLYPKEGTSVPETEWDNIKSGDIIAAACDDTSRVCKVSIEYLAKHVIGNNTSLSTSDDVAFFMHVKSLYDPAEMRLEGYNETAAAAITTPSDDDRVQFKDIQALIGATGHANYVKTRLEERVRLQPSYDHPVAGIQTATNICKVLIGDEDLGTKSDGLWNLPTTRSLSYPAGSNRPGGLDVEDCDVY